MKTHGNASRRPGPLLGLGFGLGLAACGTAGQPRDATSLATRPVLSPGEGLVVVSVVTDDPATTPEPLASAEFAVRGPKGPSFWLESGPDNALDRSTDFPGEHGRLYALVLPAGGYRVEDWRIHVPPYAVLAPSTPPPPMTFRVDPGRARYLGELHMGFVTRHKAMGLPMLETGQVSVRDRHARDLALLAARWPGLDPATIDPGLPGGDAPAVAAGPAGSPATPPRATIPEGNPPGFTSRAYTPSVPTP